MNRRVIVHIHDDGLRIGEALRLICDGVGYDEYVEEEITPLEQPKSEARRRIDLFLRRIKNIPSDPTGFDRWKNSY